MERRIVNPWTWQDQLGYVQANEIGGMDRVLICAGQTSVDADGQPLHEGNMGAQIGQALDNLETVLREAGFALADVVRMNFFVTKVDEFLQAGEIYGARLAEGGCRPATTLLGLRVSPSRCWSRSRRPLPSRQRSRRPPVSDLRHRPPPVGRVVAMGRGRAGTRPAAGRRRTGVIEPTAAQRRVDERQVRRAARAAFGECLRHGLDVPPRHRAGRVLR